MRGIRRGRALLMAGFCLFGLMARGQIPAASPAPDTLRTASGVRYLIRQPGTRALAQPGDRLTVHYTGFLPNGRIFDSSVAGGGPVRFRAARGEVIKGWDELALLLPAGTRAHAWIPATLAYGHKGSRDPDYETRYLIPPDTDLEFELEIVKVR